jgi:expansin (peptidoglycan-binding protein)
MNKSIYLPAALLMTTFTPLSLADSSTHTGEGTFYGYGGGGNCSFPKPANILTAAMNATDYDGSAACGGVIVVTNDDTGLSVTVRVDDQCPECAKGDVDLDQKAFAQIAEISKGRIPISWHYIANDQAGNMKLYFKEGSTRWWTAVQVRDHLYPIAKLAYRVTGSGSNYIDLARKPYNYFVANGGFGDGPYDFRITDFWGQTVEVSGISLVVTSEIDTGMQFPVYGGDNNPGDDPGDDPSDDPSDNPGDTTYPAETSLSTITSWSSGYCANVKVTNPNSSSLTWSVTLDVGGSVTNLWNAVWTQTGTMLTASGISWNATLDAGASTEFGFCVNY